MLHHAPNPFEVRRRAGSERARRGESEEQTCDCDALHADSVTVLEARNTVRRPRDLVMAVANGRPDGLRAAAIPEGPRRRRH